MQLYLCCWSFVIHFSELIRSRLVLSWATLLKSDWALVVVSILRRKLVERSSTFTCSFGKFFKTRLSVEGDLIVGRQKTSPYVRNCICRDSFQNRGDSCSSVWISRASSARSKEGIRITLAAISFRCPPSDNSSDLTPTRVQSDVSARDNSYERSPFIVTLKSERSSPIGASSVIDAACLMWLRFSECLQKLVLCSAIHHLRWVYNSRLLSPMPSTDSVSKKLCTFC